MIAAGVELGQASSSHTRIGQREHIHQWILVAQGFVDRQVVEIGPARPVGILTAKLTISDKFTLRWLLRSMVLRIAIGVPERPRAEIGDGLKLSAAESQVH